MGSPHRTMHGILEDAIYDGTEGANPYDVASYVEAKLLEHDYRIVRVVPPTLDAGSSYSSERAL